MDMHDCLSYDPDTGILKWKVRKGRASVGTPISCLNSSGYFHFKLDGKDYLAHRAAWELYYGTPPDGEIDHINHNRTDNRIVNLRVVDRFRQMRNRKMPKNNTSGYVGVCRYQDGWRGRVIYNNNMVLNKKFSTFDDAVWEVYITRRILGIHRNHGKRG